MIFVGVERGGTADDAKCRDVTMFQRLTALGPRGMLSFPRLVGLRTGPGSIECTFYAFSNDRGPWLTLLSSILVKTGGRIYIEHVSIFIQGIV